MTIDRYPRSSRVLFGFTLDPDPSSNFPYRMQDPEYIYTKEQYEYFFKELVEVVEDE